MEVNKGNNSQKTLLTVSIGEAVFSTSVLIFVL